MQKNLITPTQKHAMHKYSPQKAAFFMLFLGMQIPVFFPLRHETDKKVVRRGCILATRRKSRLHRKKTAIVALFWGEREDLPHTDSINLTALYCLKHRVVGRVRRLVALQLATAWARCPTTNRIRRIVIRRGTSGGRGGSCWTPGCRGHGTTRGSTARRRRSNRHGTRGTTHYQAQ